jgi:hypothetical protein
MSIGVEMTGSDKFTDSRTQGSNGTTGQSLKDRCWHGSEHQCMVICTVLICNSMQHGHDVIAR